MKKFMKYFVFILFASSVFVVGCSSDDDDPPTTPTATSYDIMTDYMVSHDMDVDVVIADWITTAEDVATKGTDAWHIIDIRGEADYNDGHIEGAVNSTLGGILTAAEGAGEKPILVVCYTGQGAGHGVIALRLSGYTDAKVLKWGMAGWCVALSGPWANSTGDAALDHDNWVAPPGNLAANAEYSAPTIESTSNDGATILAERVTAMLEGGFMGVTNGGSSPVIDFYAKFDVPNSGITKNGYLVLGAHRC